MSAVPAKPARLTGLRAFCLAVFVSSLNETLAQTVDEAMHGWI